MNYDLLAELYDLQYAHYRDDLSFYTRLADDYGSPVLELGAGSARVSAALARAGHEVIAVELSGKMIERGQARLQEVGLQERVTYQQGDMREIRLDQRSPLVIAPFNTLMHAYALADQDATLKTVREHLEPGGRFAFDLYNPNSENFGAFGVMRLEPEWSNIGDREGDLFLLQHHDPTAQIITSRYYLDQTDKQGMLRRQRSTLTQRYFTRFELERLLYGAGFTQLQLYGDFDKSRYSADAPHLIGLAH